MNPLQTFDGLFRGRLRLLLARAVNQTENHWDKKQGGEGREAQPADNRAAERRVLLAAFTEADGHRQHADDHGQSGHQHRAETRET